MPVLFRCRGTGIGFGIGIDQGKTSRTGNSNPEFGALLSVDWGNGTTTQRTFNSRARLKTLTHGPQADPDRFLNLEHDYWEGTANTDQIMSILDRNDASRSVDYAYDDFGRLKTATTQGPHWGLSWSYDPAEKRPFSVRVGPDGRAMCVALSPSNAAFTSVFPGRGWGRRTLSSPRRR